MAAMINYCDDELVIEWADDHIDNESQFNKSERVEHLRTAQFRDYVAGCRFGTWYCLRLMKSVLTDDGYCTSFNVKSQEEIFNMDTIQRDYPYVNMGRRNPHAERELSRWLKRIKKEKTHSGEKFALSLLLNVHRRYLNSFCQGMTKGFKVHLHSPDEMPRLGNHFFRVPLQNPVLVELKPNVTITSDGLKGYNPQR